MERLEQLWTAALVAVQSVLPGLVQPAPQSSAQPIPIVELRPAAPAPLLRADAVAPVIDAKSALLVDLPSNATLFAKESDKPLPIASIAKLMTALIVTERTSPEAPVGIPALPTTDQESRMGLVPGDQLKTDELLAGALIASANDAAVALAINIAGSEQNFVKLMNERAKQLGLSQTVFATASGFDKGKSYSTAKELVVLSRAVLAQPRITGLAGLKELKVRSAAGTEYTLQTTDGLIGGYLPIAGLKTGTTDEAGFCLISVVNSGDRQLLAVVLNSPDRFQENKSMLDWGLRSFRY